MNPSILSPTSRFALPKYPIGTRSPSVSPDRRRYSARNGLDPLLSDLSPTSTLQALEAGDANPSGDDALRNSLAAVSASDRAFGIRAAVMGKTLNEWHHELSGWPWPEASLSNHNGYRPLVSEEDKGFIHEDFCGSIPQKSVRHYEERIEAIRHDMDELDVEDLKAFVRDAYINPDSRPQRRRISGHGIAASDYNHLDEFTAVVTATIMHALPTISRLNSLLSEWSTRLTVLRQSPDFLKLLKETQLDMKFGGSDDQEAEIWGNTQCVDRMKALFSTRRAFLEAKIFELGRRLDTMLDLLEGREDTVPDEWIDEMEALESDFSAWVVDTERSLMEYSLRVHHSQPQRQSRSEELENFEREILEPSSNGNEGLTQYGETADEDANQIKSEHSDGWETLPITNAASLRLDGQAENIQEGIDEVSRSTQKARLFDEGLFASTSLGSTIGNVDMQKSKSRLEFQHKNTEHGLIAKEKENLNSVGNDTHVPVTGQISFLDSSIVNEHRRDLIQKQEMHTLSKRNISQEVHVDPQPPECAESQPNQVGNLKLDEAGSVDELLESLSDDGMRTERPSFETTKAPSIYSHPGSVDNLEARLPAASVGQLDILPRPSRLLIRNSNINSEESTASDVSPDTSHPGSGTSEYFSNMSSPEVQHASVAEYFKSPVEVTTPLKSPSIPWPSLSHKCSPQTMRDDSPAYTHSVTSPSFRPTNHMRRASTFAPDSSICENVELSDKARVRPNYLNTHSRVRSASLRSFEKIPRNEIRNITINRKGGIGVDSDPHIHNGKAPLPPQQLLSESTAPKALRDDDLDWPRSPAETATLPEPNGGSPTPLESSEEAFSSQSPPGGSARSQHRFENYSDLSAGSTPAKVRQRKPVTRASIFSSNRGEPKGGSSLPGQNSEDQLEARISSILTKFPGQIRLKSGPESDAHEILPSNISPGRKRPFFRSPGTKSIKTPPALSSSALTLTPAHSKKSTPRTQEGDPGIKLYHLHQPGADVPIKLFVRLVGEGGERVMVRIGGGWADLAEYLKEYAIHHGRRSTSDGRFEIQGLPQSPLANPSSGSAGFPSSPISPNSRPSSSSGRVGYAWHPSPKLKRYSFGSEPAGPETAPMTPANLSRDFRSSEPVTPGSIESSKSSYLIRPSSRLSSTTDDDSPSFGLGLAGPKTRRTAVSPSKQAWVDGMVDQARKASGEKRPGLRGVGVDTGDFGDLGRVGSTKRVFMRMRKDRVRSESGSASAYGNTATVGAKSELGAGTGAGAGAGNGTGAEAEAGAEFASGTGSGI